MRTREPAHATPNREPSSSVKFTMPMGRDGLETALAQLVERREGAHDAERPVEGPAVGDRVEVRADDDARVAGGDGGVGVAPPRPLVAHPVGRDVEAALSALPDEPLAQVAVGAGPGEAVVPAAVVVSPDTLEVPPHPEEPR